MLTLMRSFILRFTGAWAKPHCIVFPGLTQPWLTLGGRGVGKTKRAGNNQRKTVEKIFCIHNAVNIVIYR